MASWSFMLTINLIFDCLTGNVDYRNHFIFVEIQFLFFKHHDKICKHVCQCPLTSINYTLPWLFMGKIVERYPIIIFTVFLLDCLPIKISFTILLQDRRRKDAFLMALLWSEHDSFSWNLNSGCQFHFPCR